MFYEAMVHLYEAERILEDAARCGRTIDRSLIVATLHNQATVCQMIWELVRSADYIEAIIFNIKRACLYHRFTCRPSKRSSSSNWPFTWVANSI